MLVEFRCGNYSRFNQETGQYSVCGQLMTADSDEAGLIVTCPRCNSDVEVPMPKQGGSGGDRPKANRSINRDEQELGLAPEVPPQQSEAASGSSFGGVASPVAGSTRKKRRCPRCGNHLDPRGACSACRYVRPRFEKAKQSLDEMEMEPAGMMLWFSQIMSEGIPMKTLAMLCHVLIPVLAVATMVLAFLVFGPVLGGLLFMFAFASLFFYCGFAYKGYQFLRDGNTRLSWFQKPVWNFLLNWSRMKKWEGIDQRHRGRRIVDKRGEPITDETFAEIKGLKNTQILDLEGTLVTDRSLELLYQMKHLHCVVLKNTKVTHLGVTRLQQSVPRLWIWY